MTQRENFRGKRVVIAGGGDTAVDWALSLAEIAARVSVIHRRDKFRAAPESEARLKALAKAGKIDLVVPYQLQGLDGADGQLTVGHRRDARWRGRRRSRPTCCCRSSACRCRSGRSPTGGWRSSATRSSIDPATAATSKPGIFAVGDVVTYPGKLKLILTGFAEAAIAARSAYALVHPETPLHFEYSTTAGDSKRRNAYSLQQNNLILRSWLRKGRVSKDGEASPCAVAHPVETALRASSEMRSRRGFQESEVRLSHRPRLWQAVLRAVDRRRELSASRPAQSRWLTVARRLRWPSIRPAVAASTSTVRTLPSFTTCLPST